MVVITATTIAKFEWLAEIIHRADNEDRREGPRNMHAITHVTIIAPAISGGCNHQYTLLFAVLDCLHKRGLGISGGGGLTPADVYDVGPRSQNLLDGACELLLGGMDQGTVCAVAKNRANQAATLGRESADLALMLPKNDARHMCPVTGGSVCDLGRCLTVS